MKKTVSIISLAILSIAFVGAVLSDADDWEGHEADDHEEEHAYQEDETSPGGWFRSREDVAPVDNAVYRAECGACHFAYQPGLLPARAWGHIMDSLTNHYGDDASLDTPLYQQVRAYLLAHAADRSSRSRSRAFDSLEDSEGPLPRITDTRYFKREHHEIPRQFVASNADVGSFGNCQACHRGADAGVYNEHQVVIPGVGRWDD
jgi:hypothetical protein